MVIPIKMPQVGQDIEYARIIEWHVKEGESVSEGDILVTVESDKASFEVEASSDGSLLKKLYKEGEEAPVFQPIAYIGEPGETVNDQPTSASPPERRTIAVEEPKRVGLNHKSKVFSSPAARRNARENNIDLSIINGSGPEGRIVKADILREIATQQPNERISPLAKRIATEERIDVRALQGSGSNSRIVKRDIEALISPLKSVPLLPEDSDRVITFNRTKQRIGNKLSLSKQTIPHFYLFTDVDFTATLVWRKSVNEKSKVKISVNDIILKATADVLEHFPELNAHVDNEKSILKSDINIGLAVSTPHGLFVPVIPRANQRTITEIHTLAQKNAENARRGVVNPTAPSTFTVSNLGMYGISRFLPVINPPECAILSVGSVEKKVGVVNDKIAIIDNLTLGIACDHRAVDGAYASGFLTELKTRLENYSN
jgi:pyruvate dehydrogenase E2 component (dihydrolipoamide acetyltransferase)